MLNYLVTAAGAGVFELCLVGVMVIYELLGQPSGRQANGDAKVAHGEESSIAEARRVKYAAAAPVRVH